MNSDMKGSLYELHITGAKVYTLILFTNFTLDFMDVSNGPDCPSHIVGWCLMFDIAWIFIYWRLDAPEIPGDGT